jgi:polyisoprenoid-binding protein YceI
MRRNKILLLFVVVIAATAGWFLYNRYRVVVPAVDINNSEIGWSGKSVSDVHMGKIQLSKAEVKFQGGKLIGGMFEADMKSITVTDITDTADNRYFIEHIGNEDFFEVNKYPTAGFVITNVKALGEGAYEVTGTMKIKDKENPVTFTAKSEDTEKGRRIAAVVNIDRTLYGIEYGAEGKRGSEKDWFILNEIVLNINIVCAKDNA